MSDLALVSAGTQAFSAPERYISTLSLADSSSLHFVEWGDVSQSTGISCGATVPVFSQTVSLPTCTAFIIAGPVNLQFEGSGKELASFGLAGLGAYKLGDAVSTISPTDYSILFAGWREWAAPTTNLSPVGEAFPSTPATRLLTRVKQASDLTFEAIAPLMGVSRRTLHSWQAGQPISQRNEERLRALCESAEAIARPSPDTARDRIMRRIPGSVRIYDLLAEGRYDDAIKRATGAKPEARPAVYPAPRAPSTPLLSQIASLNDDPPQSEPTLDRRLTRRLGR